MQGHDIVVIGFSAGGIEPLLQLVGKLPSDLPASVFVVHHFPPQSVSALPSILARATCLPVSQASDGDAIQMGRIYVGRPDHHFLIGPGVIHLTRGPREHGSRPAIDPLFRSAAQSYGSRVIGLILSGTLDDGTLGLGAIKSVGGVAVVLDPEHAAYPGMARSALQHVAVDHVAPAGELGSLVDRLAREPVADTGRAGDRGDVTPDQEPAFAGTAALRTGPWPGAPSTFTCPDCGGSLFEREDSGLLHFRCHVGHAFTEETLLAGQSQTLEGALWGAVRALEEKAELARRLAERARARSLKVSATRFDHTAREAEHGSSVIRDSLLQGPVRQALEAPAETDDREGGRSGRLTRSHRK